MLGGREYAAASAVGALAGRAKGKSRPVATLLSAKRTQLGGACGRCNELVVVVQMECGRQGVESCDGVVQGPVAHVGVQGTR